MAEFASAIIGLAAAGAKVGTTLYNLIETLKDAPSELLALSDEVTDFRAIVARLVEARQSGEFLTAAGQDDSSHLTAVILQGHSVIAELDALVEGVRKDTGLQITGVKIQVDRVRWLRRVGKAQKLQRRLRALKGSICNFIALGMLSSSARNGIRISHLEMKVAEATQRQHLLLEKHDSMLIELTMSEKRGLTQVRPAIEGKLSGNLQTQTGGLTFPNESRRAVKARSAGSRTRELLQCLPGCSCRCHYRTVVRSPRLLSECLGDFFLGCSSLPWCFSGIAQCSEQTCRRSRRMNAEFRYFIPPWIGASMGNFSVSFNLPFIPVSATIQTLRTIPYDSPILVCSQEGDVDGIRDLLRTEQASINDVDPYGLGLLYYSAYYCWRSNGRDKAIKTCRFLIDVGVCTDWTDEIGNTAMDTIVDDTLVSLAMIRNNPCKLDPSDFTHIAQLFERPTADLIDDFIDDRELPVIHQVLLGIENGLGTLEEYLMSLGQGAVAPDVIDAPDTRGRTALAWAVEYGWHDAVKTLLRHGADARQARPSLRGDLPLLHLAIACPASGHGNSDTLEVIRLLLAAGADVRGRDHEGWTPLHVAASWNNYEVIVELAEFAGPLLEWDALTDDKQSAVDLALGGGYDDDVQRILLSRGLRTADALVNDSSTGSSSPVEYLDSWEKQPVEEMV